jgi:hypothetical protein
VEHAPTNHGAEGGVVQPLFWFIGSLCSGGVSQCPGRRVVAAPLVVPRLCLLLSCCCCWEYLWLVGGQLQRGKLVRMGEVPNLQVGPGVASRDGGVSLPVSTNNFCLMLHVSKCARSHIGQSGWWGRCGRGGIGFQL